MRDAEKKSRGETVDAHKTGLGESRRRGEKNDKVVNGWGGVKWKRKIAVDGGERRKDCGRKMRTTGDEVKKGG